MNEQLQNALAEIITSSLQTAEAAKEFVLAEMPEVVQQLLVWNMTASLIVFVVCLTSYFAVPIATYKIIMEVGLEDENDAKASAFAVGVFTVPIATTILISWGFDWLQILIAPKVYLIEYAAQLVK